jgi:transcriptional regulator with XRE-family HTH domain
MTRDAFGPNLRRLRVKKGISLEQIARTTRIPAELLVDLERNDFSAWPSGIYARAYVRQYALVVGADPEGVVDDFCRHFPEGDRRAERLVREHAEIVGHDLAWRDDLPEGGLSDRRGAAPAPAPGPMSPSPLSALFLRLRRVLGRA